MTSNDSNSNDEFDLLGRFCAQDFPFLLMILPIKEGKPSIDFLLSGVEEIKECKLLRLRIQFHIKGKIQVRSDHVIITRYHFVIE